MKKEQVLAMVADLDTADELRDFAKETLSLNIPHNAGADTARKRIVEHINGEIETEDATQVAIADEKPIEKNSEGLRLLKNSRNGRLFTYTRELAKLKNMVEVE